MTATRRRQISLVLTTLAVGLSLGLDASARAAASLEPVDVPPAPTAPAAPEQGIQPPVPAASQVHIRFREVSIVPGAQYTLGEVASITASDPSQTRRLASLVLGKSPALGVRAQLSARGLETTLEALGIGDGARIEFPERMLVQRDVQELDLEQLRRTVETELLGQMGERPDRVIVEDVRLPRSVLLPAGAVDYEVRFRLPRRGVGAVSFSAEVSVDGASERRLSGSLRVDRLVDVLRIKERLRRGERVGPEAYAPAQVHLSELRGDPLPREDLRAGLMARRDLEPGAVLTEANVEKEMLVRRGQVVRMIIERGPLRISTQGTARASGARGDRIEVLNQKSRRKVQAVVLDRGIVTVPF